MKLCSSSYGDANFGGNKFFADSPENKYRESVRTSTRFPLTLPFSSTVNCVSGPTYASYSKPLSKSRSVACAHIQAFTCTALTGLTIPKVAHMFESALQDGSKETMWSETKAKQQTTTLSRHIDSLTFERSPLVNPTLREHTPKVSATHARSSIHRRTGF